MTTTHDRPVGGSRIRRLLGIGLIAVIAFLLASAAADAKLTITQFSAGFETPAHVPVTQAGAHADMFMKFSFATKVDPLRQEAVPTESLRDVDFDLPAGMYGNPQAAPTCDVGQLQDLATQGFCSLDSQVGEADVQVGANPALDFIVGTYRAPIYNVRAADGHTAALIFAVFGASFRIDISARTDGDYGLHSSMRSLSTLLPVYGTTLHLWGVPADPAHNAQRRKSYFDSVGNPSGTPPRPFLTMPTSCEPATFNLRVRSWQDPSETTSVSATTPPLTGCDGLQFDPRISATPTKTTADRPSGFDVDVTVPQDESWSGVATPTLKKAVVTLPEGVAISPPSAQGLQACSDEELALHSTDEPTCPDASKIGTVSIDTPLLPDPLQGDIILGKPKPGQLFRLFLVARGPGLILKLPGVAQPDPRTGQLTTTFDDTPQLPFSKLHLHFKSGPRAPLATPETCGTKTTTAEFTSWAGSVVTPSDSFDITGCTGGFSPTFEAGSLSPHAGAFSPFTMTIRRNDGDQELSGISVNLPPGLLGILSGIPQCPEAQAAAGACDASSQVGTTTVESGSGAQPLPLTGKVYLAGPYKGAPFSLSIVVKAIAGPFDLGTVVVRAPINIDAAAGKVSVPADPLPTILEGVPLRLKTINVTLDRPGFMFNATNCDPMAVGVTLTSVTGATATPSSPYHASGCASLPLKPKFSFRLKGRLEMKKLGHPSVVADLSQAPGEAGLKSVEVTLPPGVSVDTKNTGLACTAADAAARNCPATSIVGKASARTPALPVDLSGPVYFVQGSRTDPKTGRQVPTLPKLWLKLEGGGVPLDLRADTNIVKGRVVTTFPAIPDAPIASFHLEINGGPKGILQTGRDQCASSRTTNAVFTGHNGRVLRRAGAAFADCAPRIVKTKLGTSAVSLTVSGIGAGRLTVAGAGVTGSSRTIKGGSSATITASLAKKTLAKVARAGSARLRLTVTFTPTGGKATTLRKSMTIKRSVG